MKITPAPLPGVIILEPLRHEDERGVFAETFRLSEIASLGFADGFLQENTASSRKALTLRGLHFQTAPAAQAKLVRVVRGTVFDAVVDLREGSPTFGRSFCLELSAANWRQLLVPQGFAHGYLTLEADTEVNYKVSAPYSRGHEGGLLWSDPELGIPWPADPQEIIVNDRDRAWPPLAAFRPGADEGSGADARLGTG